MKTKSYFRKTAGYAVFFLTVFLLFSSCKPQTDVVPTNAEEGPVGTDAGKAERETGPTGTDAFPVQADVLGRFLCGGREGEIYDLRIIYCFCKPYQKACDSSVIGGSK